MEETSTLTIKDGITELIPDESDPNVGREVFKILGMILQYKADQGLPDKWQRCYELSRGRHWRKESKKVTLITANLIHTHRQRTTAMLTDNNPTFNANQTGEIPAGSEEKVDMLRHTASHWWSTTEQQDTFESSVIGGETYGVAIEKVRFDPKAEYAIGEVVTDRVDPYQFGWYPCEAEDSQKADANLHFWPMPLREARRRWPDFAGDIVADQEWVSKLGDDRKDVKSPMSKDKGGVLSTIAGTVKNMFNNADEGTGLEDSVLVVEAWVKDRTRITNDDGTEQDKYPGNIRCVWVCNGGELVLEDRTNPSINWDVLPMEQAMQTHLFDKFPFNLAVSVKDTASPWGMTDYEQLEGLQIEMNKTLSQITLSKDKASRVTVVNPQNSGVSNNQFNNAFGIINPKNHVVADSIRVLEQAKIPAEMTAVFQLYRELFFLISGGFDLEQADAPGSNAIAYKAIAALLERVATLLRGKLRNYHKLIRNRGRMYLSCAMNWYIDERWVTYDVDGEKQSSPIKGPDMIMPAKLDVVSGSTMPVSKIQQREEALELFKLQAIDVEELLKRMEWPNHKEVAARIKAGPFKVFIDRLVEMGLPGPVGEYFLNIALMDQNDYDKAMENGELPGVMQVMAQVMQTQPQLEDQPQESPIDNAEVALKEAQTRKVEMDILYVQEQINNLKTEQRVKSAGIGFDTEKLKIERARTVDEIARNRKAEERQDIDTLKGLEREGKEDERADKQEDRSDQAEKRADQAEKREDKRLAAEIETKEAEQKAQGPYREKGLKSNNKK